MLLATAPPAFAQVPTAVGPRAQGMAGAFTAVADDATATWWNPAGLATGAYFSMVLERGRVEDWRGDGQLEGAVTGFSVAYPALGLSYYRIRADEAGVLSIAAGAAGREESEVAEPGVRGVAISQFGVTVGQSLGDALVVATTLKLLRAGEIRQPGAGVIGDVAALDVPVSARFDLDFGVMASLGPLRLGGLLRNVRTPEFDRGNGSVLRLERQARVGAALVSDRLPWPVNLAVDADLTETDTVLGEVRHAAAGLEGWLWQRRLALRGGLSVNTAGAGGQAASGGVSLMLQSGLHLEGAITRGSDKSREGWSVGMSVSF